MVACGLTARSSLQTGPLREHYDGPDGQAVKFVPPIVIADGELASVRIEKRESQVTSTLSLFCAFVTAWRRPAAVTINRRRHTTSRKRLANQGDGNHLAIRMRWRLA